MKWCEAFEVPDDATVGSVIGTISMLANADDIFATIKWFVVSIKLTIEITDKTFMYTKAIAI